MSLDFSIQNGVAKLTINRPERMNAVEAETAEQMERAWQDIEADKSIRCVVLTGAGDRAFSAGADLKSDAGLTGLEYWAQQNPNGFGGGGEASTMTSAAATVRKNSWVSTASLPSD